MSCSYVAPHSHLTTLIQDFLKLSLLVSGFIMHKIIGLIMIVIFERLRFGSPCRGVIYSRLYLWNILFAKFPS